MDTGSQANVVCSTGWVCGTAQGGKTNLRVDSHTGRNRQFPLADLLRQSVYSRLKATGSPLSPVIAQFPDMQYLNGDRRVILDRFL